MLLKDPPITLTVPNSISVTVVSSSWYEIIVKGHNNVFARYFRVNN